MKNASHMLPSKFWRKQTDSDSQTRHMTFTRWFSNLFRCACFEPPDLHTISVRDECALGRASWVCSWRGLLLATFEKFRVQGRFSPCVYSGTCSTNLLQQTNGQTIASESEYPLSGPCHLHDDWKIERQTTYLIVVYTFSHLSLLSQVTFAMSRKQSWSMFDTKCFYVFAVMWPSGSTSIHTYTRIPAFMWTWSWKCMQVLIYVLSHAYTSKGEKSTWA